jgi:protease IV
MGMPWRDETGDEAEKEQALVDAIYASFVRRVAHARHLPEDRVRELATGEVWLDEQALALGLVDEIGDLERAVEIAAAMADVPARGAPIRIRRPLVGRLLDRFAVRVAMSLADEIELRPSERFRL